MLHDLDYADFLDHFNNVAKGKKFKVAREISWKCVLEAIKITVNPDNQEAVFKKFQTFRFSNTTQMSKQVEGFVDQISDW